MDEDDVVSRLNKKRKLEATKISEANDKIKTLENKIYLYEEKEKLANKKIKSLEEDIKFQIEKHKISNDDWVLKIQNITRLYKEKSTSNSELQKTINQLNLQKLKTINKTDELLKAKDRLYNILEIQYNYLNEELNKS